MPNAAWVPNGCDHFNIDCCSLDIPLDCENWSSDSVRPGIGVLIRPNNSMEPPLPAESRYRRRLI